MINGEIKQNVWDIVGQDDVVCILTNNSIIDGKNPMGGGIAREALDRNPGLDEVVAKMIKKNEMYLCRDAATGARLVRFATKTTIDQPSNLNLIRDNLVSLRLMARMYPKLKFYLPRPGCGFGGLNWENEVRPLCEEMIGTVGNIYIVSK